MSTWGAGLFNTTRNPAELNTRSFAGTILRLFPNGSAPMFALSSQSGKSKAKSSTHGYFSKVMKFITLAVPAGGFTNVATDWNGFASTAGMVKSMVLHNLRTRESVLVTAVDNATDLTVVRGFGRVAAAAMNAGDKLICVGTANAEGSVRPAARNLNTTYIPNFTQIFRNAWALTDTARASLAEQGWSNVAENRKDCSMFHAVDIEAAIIWGQPLMDTTGEQPMHTTQGVIDALEQYAPGNTNPAGATTSYSQFVDMVEPAFQYATDASNPKERIAFGDNTAIKVLNKMGRLAGDITITQNETSFGMSFQQIKFYKGTINLVEHPLMNGLGTQGNLLIMDMAALKLAYLDGRDTKAEEYGTGGKQVENGIDAVGGSLTTECAVELINPYSCAYIEGLTDAVAG